MKCSLEVVRRAYDDDEGVYIEVGPSADNPHWISVSTSDPKSSEYYGKIDLSLPPEQARMLGYALIDATDKSQAKK